MNNILNKNLSKKFGIYLPMFFLMCFSGNPLFTEMNYSKPLLVVFSILFIIYCVINLGNKYISKNLDKLIIVSAIILIITFLQYLYFGEISLQGVFALILKIALVLFIYLYYNRKKINFLVIYIRLLTILTLLSFPFWLFNQFKSWGIPLENPILKSTVFYTMFPTELETYSVLVRNAGMFWEPGAFSGYIVLAFLFMVVLNKNFTYINFKREFQILSLGLLSTQSTTGYLMYILLIVAHFSYNYKVMKFVLVPIIIVLIIFIYSGVSFLSEKIDSQYTEAAELEKSDASPNRFAAIVMDWQYISSSPIIGNSLNDKIRWRFHSWIVSKSFGHGNGMSNFIVWWGIPFFLFWLYSFYRFTTTKVKNKYINLTLIVLIVLMLQGEQFLNYPIFLLFFVLPLNFDYLEIVNKLRTISNESTLVNNRK